MLPDGMTIRKGEAIPPSFGAASNHPKHLTGLFDRFPALRLAVPPADLEPVPSVLGNGHVALPVQLGAF